MDINPGDIVRVATTPGFTNAAGALTDPTVVRLKWRAAGGATTTWIYGTDSQIVRDSVGMFHADIPVVAAGLHYFRWEGTGAVIAAEESTFIAGTTFP